MRENLAWYYKLFQNNFGFPVPEYWTSVYIHVKGNWTVMSFNYILQFPLTPFELNSNYVTYNYHFSENKSSQEMSWDWNCYRNGTSLKVDDFIFMHWHTQTKQL